MSDEIEILEEAPKKRKVSPLFITNLMGAALGVDTFGEMFRFRTKKEKRNDPNRPKTASDLEKIAKAEEKRKRKQKK